MPTRSTRRAVLAIALAAAGTAFVATPSFAYDENSTAAVNVDAKGIGLRGHDPVAYFTVGAPTPGNPEYSASHGGVKYLFASKTNLETFKKNPAKYAPQYGGFCAMGVANGVKLDGMPNVWRIHDGKLYLNVGPTVMKVWSSDIQKYDGFAVKNWPDIKNQSPKALDRKSTRLNSSH